ncbi:hypothetical protein CEP54_009064 [Fusarium duplospermum]|uniref:Uncharacterized protein n=1 Tax=Fusarium duplospermum TaxID=1325734 RepID=A0A428PSQ3_9HYPO|nr:hypothetical protein CEP54_009064 [Fusarium duplospermum]
MDAMPCYAMTAVAAAAAASTPRAMDESWLRWWWSLGRPLNGAVWVISAAQSGSGEENLEVQEWLASDKFHDA